MNLEDCLPQELRTSSTVITRVAAGLSGAGVYRVEADGQAYVLKVSAEHEGLEDWHHKVAVLRSASDAGLAPPVVHVDHARRAVVSKFIEDRSFAALYVNPATHELAVTRLGQTLRRVHELPLPAGLVERSPLDLLDRVKTSLAGFAVPSFVVEAIEAMRAEQAPPSEHAAVLSHNDVNPTNLRFDGQNLLLLDWDMAGPNDPLYDLAAIALFLRMNDESSLRLLSAHGGSSVGTLPARFRYLRRLVAVLCGTIFLMLARRRGHAGNASLALEGVMALGDLHQQMRAGQVDVSTADGQWSFGLALLRAGIELESAERST